MSLLSLMKAAAPVAAPIVGGLLNRNTAANATNTLTGGVNNAINTVQTGANNAGRTLADVWKEQQGMLDPYRTAGMPATTALANGVLPGGDLVKPFNADTFDLYKDPGYQWRVQQGQRGIEAGANAGGIRFSGATLKALSAFNQESASQEYTAARNRAEQDQQNRYDREMGVSNIGQNAANTEVAAGGTYGTNLSRLQTNTADQIAGLQTDLASAQAAGDTAKANAITDTIDKVTTAAGLIKPTLAAAGGAALPGAGSFAAPTVASIIGGSGGTAVGAGTSLAAIQAGAVPEIASSAIGLGAPGSAALAGTTAAAPATGITGALGLGGGSGLFGLGAATIPVVGGAILGGALLIKHYAGAGRKQADKLTGEGGLQNAFEKTLAQIDASPDFTPEQKWQGKTSAYDELEKQVLQFAQKGKNQHKVASQMFDTISHLFGKPNPLRGAA